MTTSCIQGLYFEHGLQDRTIGVNARAGCLDIGNIPIEKIDSRVDCRWLLSEIVKVKADTFYVGKVCEQDQAAAEWLIENLPTFGHVPHDTQHGERISYDLELVLRDHSPYLDAARVGRARGLLYVTLNEIENPT